jgi:hypothetical protein
VVMVFSRENWVRDVAGKNGAAPNRGMAAPSAVV